MQEHHYLGALPKISETLWYVATFGDQWVALLSFSAAALKCSPRDRWIGWDFRHQYDRLKLLTNNSRFLILPDWHFRIWPPAFYRCAKRDCRPIGSKFSAIPLCCWRPLWTRNASGEPSTKRPTGSMWATPRAFIGPERLQRHGTLTENGFCQTVKPNAQALLSRPVLEPAYRTGGPKIMLSAQQMQSLPDFFAKTSPIRAVPKDDAIDCPRS
jgi:hypothetical protein